MSGIDNAPHDDKDATLGHPNLTFVRECDEYPFATTYEGAAEHDHDADAKKFNFSVKPIAKEDNGAAGNLLRSFYAKNRIIDGTDDGFIVKIVS